MNETPPSARIETPDIEQMSFAQKMGVFKRVFANITPYKPYLVLMFILTLIEVGLSMVDPFLTKVLIDDVFVQKDSRLLNIIFGIMISLFVVKCFYGFLTGYISFYMNNRINFDLRKRFFEHLQRLSIRFYEQNPLAQIAHTENTNLPQMQGFLITSLDDISNSLIHVVAGVTLMCLVHFKLACFALLALPLWVYGTVFFTNKLAPIQQALNMQAIRIKDVFFEFISGIQVVKTCRQEHMERKRFFSQLLQDAWISADGMVWGQLFTLIVGSISTVATAFVFWYGGHAIIKGDLSIGQLVMFNMFLMRIMAPLGRLLEYYRNTNEICVAALQVYSVWDLKPEIQDAPNAILLPRYEGNIEFYDVSFQYEPGEMVLQDVSLEVMPNTMVAFCGPSGSGKSTIAKLAARLYDPTQGVVFADGFDLKTLSLSNYLDQVGMVTQRPFMFHDTVLHNIQYGRPSATMEEVERAARIAQAHDFIMAFPQQYDTPIGSQETGLSGGQIQRIAIARVLLRDPKILILDEATSALDTQTEMLFQQAVDHLLRDRTILVIAHRLSTIVNADRIFVLDQGRIVESGTHPELVARRGLYFSLYERQAAEAVAAA